MKYFVTTIASLLATIVAARGGEKAPPAATDDGNIMSRVLALEKIVEEQRVQLEDVHDVVSSLHSRRTQAEKCVVTKNGRLFFKCKVVMRKSLEVSKEFTAHGDTLFEGGNVFITNGMGLGYLNGKGNLIVGGNSADDVANPGSHNVIIGANNKYSSYGGIVAGNGNDISAEYASVTGGSLNTASGPNSSVTGGTGNIASGALSSISGGANSIAAGWTSSISGGANNKATGYVSSITGGNANVAAGFYSSIGGGSGNQTPYEGSTVTGTRDKQTQRVLENLP